jgi:dihydroorotate dehydrogenase
MPLWNGVWNNVGLANKGFGWWMREVAPRLKSDIPLLVSLYPDSLDFIKEASITLSQFETIKGIELNFSCPNAREFNLNTILGFVRNLKYTTLPVILKLNAKQIWHSSTQELQGFLSVVSGIVEAISLNSVPVSMLKGSVFKTGAISGKRIADLNWSAADKIVKLGFENVIYPSVWSYKDILDLKCVGAKAVSFGSVHLLHPAAPSHWVIRYRLEGAGLLEKKGVKNVS